MENNAQEVFASKPAIVQLFLLQLAVVLVLGAIEAWSNDIEATGATSNDTQ